jgi:hypothetical protein
METIEDVVTFLRNQHAQLRELLELVAESRGVERQAHFGALRRILAVHEATEEQVVHPAARATVFNGAAIVDAHLREERKAKQALIELEKLDVDSRDFEIAFGVFESDFRVHAESEERAEFVRLRAALSPYALVRMSKAAELAEAAAPTRPHPHLESRTANILVGPFAAIVDRARDALWTK